MAPAPCQLRIVPGFALGDDADALREATAAFHRQESDCVSEASTISETLLGQLQACCPAVLDLSALQALSVSGDRRVRHVLIALWQSHEENMELQAEVHRLRAQAQEKETQAKEERRRVVEELTTRDDQQWVAVERLGELLGHLRTMLAMTVDLLPLDGGAATQAHRALAECWGRESPLSAARLGSWDAPLGQFEPLLDSGAHLIDIGLHMVGEGYAAPCRPASPSPPSPPQTLATSSWLPVAPSSFTALALAGFVAGVVWWAAGWLLGLWWATLRSAVQLPFRALWGKSKVA